MNEPELSKNLVTAPDIESIEILELLGKGGMSLVYKARQKQLDRIVAVKVLSKLAEDGIKRFLKEAKLTSKLDHPNIVRTISFGVSKDEQPYLVMEYLEGLSLADELTQNRCLSLQKFKDIFLPALSALGQAHESGLLHRDIKPGNIMICRNETGVETVKLVDFGIAKRIGAGESDTVTLTKSGEVLGSPAYMSPEQCLGQSLDGRSDLYSMACVMYETLSGEPPFSGDSVLEVMQKHCKEPPPSVLDFSRKTGISRKHAELTLWGLAKDPSARPQTAAELKERLSEVLEEIPLDKIPRLMTPVAASSKTPLKIAITIAIVLLCIILCGVIYFVCKKAMPAQEKLNAFRSVDLHKKQRQGKQELERMYKLKPAEHLNDLIELYKNQNKWAQAEIFIKQDLANKEEMFGPNDDVVAESLCTLGECYVREGKCSEAEPLYRRAVAIDEKVLGANHPGLVDRLQGLASCSGMQGKYADGELLFKRAIAIREKAFGPKHPDVAHCLIGLAVLYTRQGKYALAEPLYRRALAIRQQALGPNNQGVAEALESLADCLQAQGRYAEALPLSERVLAFWEKELGPDNPDLLQRLDRLANCFNKQGKPAAAEPLLKRALAMREKARMSGQSK